MSKDIVTDLQKDLINQSKPTSEILPKAYLIAKKLQLEDFSSWLKLEMDGYRNIEEQNIPDYRSISGQIKAKNPFNGWIPVCIDDKKLEKKLSERKCSQSIKELEKLLEENKDKNLYTALSGEFSKLLDYPLPCGVFYGRSQFVAILNLVRNKILDWTLDLESKGIKGKNMEFLEEEVEKAQTSSTTTVNNIYGGTNNFQVAQGNDTVNQTQNNRPESLLSKLWSWIKSIFSNRR